MSIYGTAGSGTYSVSYPNLDAMMADLKDNTSGAILASTLRNAVLTLYDTSATASINSSSVIYTSNTASTVAIGGLTAGTNFSAGLTIQQMFDSILHPYVAPVINNLSLSVGSGGPYSNIVYLENGSTSYNQFYIKWNITQGSVNLLGNILLPNNIRFNGSSAYFRYNGNAIGYIQSLATQSGIITVASASNTTEVVILSVNDGVNPISLTASVVFQDRFYWGNYPTDPSSHSFITTDFNGASVSIVDSTGTNTGNILTNTKVQTLNGINGAGNYLVFAMPTYLGSPVFIANGLLTTAFTNKSINFSNQYGIVASYSLWYSNTVQNSPINYFQIN